MKKLAIILAVSAAACVSFAQDAKAVALIKGAHAKFEQAMRKNDSAAAKKVVTDYFASDFTYAPVKGAKQTRAQFLSTMTPSPGVTFTKFQFGFGSFVQKGNTITVTTSTTVQASMVDNQGKSHVMKGSGSDKETWVKTGGTWKMKSMVGVTENMTVDGKPFGG